MSDVRRPGISDEGDWVGDFFKDADSLRLERLVAWFSDDIEVRFANQPSIRGRDAAEAAFRDFWALINGMGHRREELVLAGDLAAQMSIVTYRRKQGGEVSLPVASHLRRTVEGRIDRLWIFIDLAPLFAAGT